MNINIIMIELVKVISTILDVIKYYINIKSYFIINTLPFEIGVQQNLLTLIDRKFKI